VTESEKNKEKKYDDSYDRIIDTPLNELKVEDVEQMMSSIKNFIYAHTEPKEGLIDLTNRGGFGLIEAENHNREIESHNNWLDIFKHMTAPKTALHSFATKLSRYLKRLHRNHASLSMKVSNLLIEIQELKNKLGEK